MAIFKCKMCGGSLDVATGTSVVECEYCGTNQTLPTAADENLHSLFNRANTLRMKSEFDKAEQLYEKILQADGTQAEAYWGLILCKYGIEYVEDPKTFARIPTCHRTSFDSIIADDDYKSALEHADASSRALYEKEAREIDRIQKDILALSQKEEPYDVFICYKETDDSGKRTQDSVIANDIYYELTKEGFKVFYAAITLEDKLGTAYEPSIFAALNSAKVMLAIGTKPEYFSAVWVKNEWSRYLKMMKADRSKLLIPCYRDMDPYELPEEFAHLQAQDMGKIGFINDIVRGIKKVLVKDAPAPVEKVVVETTANASTAPLLKRAFMFLEDGDWNSANEYCEKVLDIDPECADAYIGKLMAELEVTSKELLQDCAEPFDANNNYKKALRFADDKLRSEITGYIEHINSRNNAAQDALAAERERCNDLLKSLEDIQRVESKKKQLSSQLEPLEKQLKKFARLSVEFPELQQKLDELKNEQNDLQIEISSLNSKKASLGIFAGKQKKELDQAINSVESKLRSLNSECTITASKLEGFSSIEEINEKSEQVTKQLAEVHQAISELESSVGMSRDEIISELNASAVGSEMLTKRSSWGYIGALENSNSIVILKSDGSVVWYDYMGKLDLSNWSNITSIAMGMHIVGLRSNGTVAAVGYNENGECNVHGWSDIVAVSTGTNHTVGLKSDGTVVAVGLNKHGQCNVSHWRDIVSVSATYSHTLGVKSNGTVIYAGENLTESCNVDGWTDIVSISAGFSHTVGLRSNGTVVATGRYGDGQCDVSGWTDIISVAAGNAHTVGLKSDGTVVAVGYNKDGQCNVNEWTDIVSISVTDYGTFGVTSDGRVVAAGKQAYLIHNLICKDITDQKLIDMGIHVKNTLSPENIDTIKFAVAYGMSVHEINEELALPKSVKLGI